MELQVWCLRWLLLATALVHAADAATTIAGVAATHCHDNSVCDGFGYRDGRCHQVSIEHLLHTHSQSARAIACLHQVRLCRVCDFRRLVCAYLYQCNCCPRCWTCAELLSRHYDCATSNAVDILKVTSHRGKVAPGDLVRQYISKHPFKTPCESESRVRLQT